MTVVLHIFQGIFALLAAGLLSGFFISRHLGILLGAIVYGSGAYASYTMQAWWPLPVSFVAAWGLRLLGFDPNPNQSSSGKNIAIGMIGLIVCCVRTKFQSARMILGSFALLVLVFLGVRSMQAVKNLPTVEKKAKKRQKRKPKSVGIKLPDQSKDISSGRSVERLKTGDHNKQTSSQKEIRYERNPKGRVIARTVYEGGRKSLRSQIKGTIQINTYFYYHSNGRIKREGSAIGKKREGVWSEWYSDGQIKERATYRNDVIDGKATSWHSNGKKKDERYYLMGKVAAKKWNSIGKLIINEFIWTKTDREEYEVFKYIIMSHAKAITYIRVNMTEEDDKRFFDLMKTACSGHVISDDFLNKLHPELQPHFRDEFCRAMYFCRKTLIDNDKECWSKYKKLYGKWVKWFSTHNNEFSKPSKYNLKQTGGADYGY